MYKTLFILFASAISICLCANDQDAKAAAQAEERVRNQAIRKYMEDIRFDDPQKHSELLKLRKDNYKEFSSQAFKLAEDESARRKLEAEELKSLVKSYQEKPSAELKSQIIAKLAQAFQRRAEREQKIIENLENTAKDRKARLEKQLNNRDKLIQAQFKKISTDPAAKW
jgi:hypothetical protein